MPVVDVYNQNREKVAELDLDGAVFDAEVKEHLLHAAVRYQLNKRRQGTHAVKRRSDVRGGGAKPWRQKGTGRARAGTSRSPIWRGGGVVFGPEPRSYAIKLNKKVRRAALRGAISRRVQENKLVVLDQLSFSEIKTRQVAELLARFELESAVIVLPEKDEVVMRSARNIPGITVLPAEGLNVYDVLYRDNLVMTQGAVSAVTERLGRS